MTFPERLCLLRNCPILRENQCAGVFQHSATASLSAAITSVAYGRTRCVVQTLAVDSFSRALVVLSETDCQQFELDFNMPEKFGKYEYDLEKRLGNTKARTGEGPVYEGHDTEVGSRHKGKTSKQLKFPSSVKKLAAPPQTNTGGGVPKNRKHFSDQKACLNYVKQKKFKACIVDTRLLRRRLRKKI